MFMLLMGGGGGGAAATFIQILKVVRIEEKRGFVCILRLRGFLKVTPVSVL